MSNGVTYIDADHLGISKIGRTYATSFYKTGCQYKERPMVCKITGICQKYGYKREFLKPLTGSVDKHPNLKIVKFDYEKEMGFIFGYKNFMLSHLTFEVITQWQYFLPTFHGLVVLEPEQVRTSLNMPVKNRAMGIWPSLKPQGKNYVDDDVPF